LILVECLHKHILRLEVLNVNFDSIFPIQKVINHTFAQQCLVDK
jgi:hypothetical protein